MSLELLSLKVNIPQKTACTFNGKIDTGKILALMGPSGCGKSTFLKCISGLYKQESGKIRLNNIEIQHLKAENRGISFAFQTPPFLPQFNVLKNLFFPLKFQEKYKSFEQKVLVKKASELLEKFNLEKLAPRNPATLSRGEAQRISLLRALITEPNLLLLDEPLSAIDSESKKDLKTWLKKLLKERLTTTIIVTHDSAEAAELADKTIVWREKKDTIDL